MLNLIKNRVSFNHKKYIFSPYNKPIWNLNLRLFCTSKNPSVSSLETDQELKKAHENIYKKTREGVKTLRAMGQVEYTKDGAMFNRKLEYEEFIERMMKTYKGMKNSMSSPYHSLHNSFDNSKTSRI